MQLSVLATLCGATLQGDDCEISGVGTLESGSTGDISFLTNPKYRRHLTETPVSAVILNAKDAAHCPEHLPCLISDNPYLAYAIIAGQFVPDYAPVNGIHPTAVVHATAEIADDVGIAAHAVIGPRCHLKQGVVVGANTVLGADVTIGAGSVLEANVTLWHAVKIGEDCLIHSGAVIGSDGFGNAKDGHRWVKIPQLGTVIIGDRVEIGANTTIDRGAIENTVIADGVRLDNQIQIGHNAIIGEDTAMAAFCGVAGSAIIGKRVMIGGMSGIAGHIDVGDDSFITGMSMITHSLPAKSAVASGIPARPVRDWHKTVARLNKLTTLEQRVKALEAQLEQVLNHSD